MVYYTNPAVENIRLLLPVLHNGSKGLAEHWCLGGSSGISWGLIGLPQSGPQGGGGPGRQSNDVMRTHLSAS